MKELLTCSSCAAPLDYKPGDGPVVRCGYCGANVLLSTEPRRGPSGAEPPSRAVESDDARRKALSKQMASTNRAEATAAVVELRLRGWLTDGSLRGESFIKANLEGADMQDAVLHGGSLRYAQLHGVNLSRADLRGVNLLEADLSGANLTRARLQRAEPRYADLQGAILRMADLRDAKMFASLLQAADLSNARLEGADIRNARFDRRTVLPDGARWTPGIDTTRFTDPEHPSFWQPNEAEE